MDAIVHESSDESDDEQAVGIQKRKLQLEVKSDDFDILEKPSFKMVKRQETKPQQQPDDPFVHINSEGKIVVQEVTRKRKHEEAEELEEEQDSKSQARSHAGSIGSKKYRPGGRGIHRPLDQESASGRNFKSKREKSDEKRKGVSVDPYAYVPLNRAALNKRRTVSAKKQFKQFVSKKSKKD